MDFKDADSLRQHFAHAATHAVTHANLEVLPEPAGLNVPIAK
jgi:hypothetical protein